MSKCGRCGADVITTDAGTALNPDPGRFGRHMKDGSFLSGDEIRNPQIRGYYEHHCMTPKKQTTNQQSSQGSLF